MTDRPKGENEGAERRCNRSSSVGTTLGSSGNLLVRLPCHLSVSASVRLLVRLASTCGKRSSFVVMEGLDFRIVMIVVHERHFGYLVSLL